MGQHSSPSNFGTGKDRTEVCVHYQTQAGRCQEEGSDRAPQLRRYLEEKRWVEDYPHEGDEPEVDANRRGENGCCDGPGVELESVRLYRGRGTYWL